MALMSAADLTAPGSGFLWQLNASNGELVAAGDPLVELVNCQSALLLAEIPQDRVPDVLIGARAHIRLSGETRERYGVVEAIVADPTAGESRNLAASPLKNSDERMAAVQIKLEEAPARVGAEPRPCLVGRTASVMMPVAGNSGLPLASHVLLNRYVHLLDAQRIATHRKDGARQPAASRTPKAVVFPFATATSICRNRFTICQVGTSCLVP